MKKCIKCKKDLPESEFYANKINKDGLQVYCKECNKLNTNKWRSEKRKEPNYYNGYTDWSKYYEKRKLYRERYPEKIIAQAKTRKVKLPSGYEKHHWSYREDHWFDYIILSKQDHSLAHKCLIYDQERMMFRTMDGLLLDSKEEHLSYINKYIKSFHIKVDALN